MGDTGHFLTDNERFGMYLILFQNYHGGGGRNLIFWKYIHPCDGRSYLGATSEESAYEGDASKPLNIKEIANYLEKYVDKKKNKKKGK